VIYCVQSKASTARSLLDAYERRAIRDEITVHSALSHPGVTSFYGWFEDTRGGAPAHKLLNPNPAQFTTP
jgi:hypothetical protein